MGLFDRFPYTNFHELNLDWIIGRIKNVETAEANAQQSAQNAAASANSAAASAQTAEQSAQTAEQSAQSAASSAAGIESARQQIQLNSNRIDTILVEGTPTQGNAELIDIRTGANGLTYQTAGDAVRGQFLEVKNDFDLATTGRLVETYFIEGYYLDANDYQQYANASYSVTDFLPVGNEIATTAAQNSGGALIFYDENRIPIASTKNYTNIDIPMGAVYFRVTNYTPNQGNPTVTVRFDPVDMVRRAAFGSEKFLAFFTDIVGFFIDYATGRQVENANYRCSGYIPLFGGRPILQSYFYSTLAGFAFYDENRDFISGFNTYDYTMPLNARYMRISAHVDQIGTVFIPVVPSSLLNLAKVFIPSMQGYIDYNTGGEFYYHPNYKCTDFLPVPRKIETTCIQNSGACIGFYDRNLDPISVTKDYQNITIPQDAVYFRVSDYDENNQQTGQVICYYTKPLDDYNPLNGRKLSFIGDSLMTTDYKNPSEAWPAVIAARNSATAVNLAISGNPIAENPSYSGTAMCDRISSIPSDSDYIVLMGGANDANHHTAIGSDTDTQKTTFKGALNSIITELTASYPKAKILFITTYRRTADRSDEPYANAMLDICELNQINCIDMYHAGGLHFMSPEWMTIYGAWTWSGDASQKLTNKHLNAAGDYFVASIYEAKMKSI